MAQARAIDPATLAAPRRAAGRGWLAARSEKRANKVAVTAATHRVTFPEQRLPYLLLLPQLLVLAWFFFWPAAQAVYQAFTITDAFGGNTQFVWFENFTRLLDSPEYHLSLWVTLIFSAGVTAVSLGFGLLFALAADRVIRGSQAYRVLLIWPYAVAPAIAGALWIFMLNPSSGIVAHAIRTLGLYWQPDLNATHAMLLVVLAAAWKQVAYNFIFFLAGMQSIPKNVIEAAAIDGAGPIRRVWTIVLPLLSPTLFFLIVVNIVYAFFETFGVISVTTHGGPGDSTSILVYKVFIDGFVGLDYGASSAQSMIIMLIVIGLTVVQFRCIERRVHYA
ncbi:MAG: sn-glycerol-3-phosphate ABC transporter permease UgpA [Rhizobiales bacterium]|nr:sn-glycerol-3-phosphate ABC transporter permease UgpA [Hyphomicrobiales bacterium]